MTTKEPVQKAAADEGARSFAVIVQQVDEGALHGELSEQLHALTTYLSDYAEKYGCEAKGKLTLTLSLKAKSNGTVDVVGDVTKKEPKAPRAGSVFWVTPGNNLSPENPRQMKLPVREVPAAPKAEARDVPAENPQPVRSV